MIDPKHITLIIINYKTSHLIQGLLNSIVENDALVSILIVDNSSSIETYNELNNIKDKRVTILCSKSNLGFTGGINFALKYLIQNQKQTKYFALFNPDSFSCKNLLSDLMKLLESNPEAGCISPKILHFDGSPWYSGGMLNLAEGAVINNPDCKNENSFFEVDVFSGCASIFNFEKVIEAGMFNENLFMYFDEADFSIKFKKLGYKILYSNNHSIFHDVSYTTKNTSHIKTYYMTRNKFIVFNKYMSLSKKIYYLIYQFAYHVKNGRIKNAFYHLKGYIDFTAGITGQMKNS